MQINFKEIMKEMPAQEIFDIAQAAKNELGERFARDSAYEPTGDLEKDEKHYREVEVLQNMLAKL